MYPIPTNLAIAVREYGKDADTSLYSSNDIERLRSARSFQPRGHEPARPEPQQISQHHVSHRDLNAKVSMRIQNICVRSGRRKDSGAYNEAVDKADQDPAIISLTSIVSKCKDSRYANNKGRY